MPPMEGFPIPQDRTPNNPCILLTKAQVLHWYQVFTGKPKHAPWDDTETMPTVVKAAKNLGWSEVTPQGKELLLIAMFKS